MKQETFFKNTKNSKNNKNITNVFQNLKENLQSDLAERSSILTGKLQSDLHGRSDLTVNYP